MSDKKIIQIPVAQNQDDSYQSMDYEYEEYTSSKGKILLPLFLFLLIIVLAAIVLHILMMYDDMEVRSSTERRDSTETKYEDWKGNLLKYSTDGIFYTDYNGTLIWNYTYDMASPSIALCGEYGIVYDKKGTEINLFSVDGFVKTIKTTMPIMDADVAGQGTSAVLLQENGTSYLQLYNTSASLLAAGELHPENSGYPISMAISSDAKKLMVSLINLNGGNIRTTIQFYDFGNAGKEAVDNIIANYNYDSVIIPEVDFVANDRAIAFADNQIVVFDNNTTCSIDKKIEPSSSMKSVFHNDRYFGYVCEVPDENEEIENRITVYNMYGMRCFTRRIDEAYTEISILKDNEIMLSNGQEVNLYNLQGVHRFSYVFDNTVYKMIPDLLGMYYTVIKDNYTEVIRLK